MTGEKRLAEIESEMRDLTDNMFHLAYEGIALDKHISIPASEGLMMEMFKGLCALMAERVSIEPPSEEREVADRLDELDRFMDRVISGESYIEEVMLGCVRDYALSLVGKRLELEEVLRPDNVACTKGETSTSLRESADGWHLRWRDVSRD